MTVFLHDPDATLYHGDALAAPIPCTVLDPFVGAGTVPYVARKLGLRAIGIDLNESYLEMAARRLAQQSLFATTAEDMSATVEV